MFFSLTTVQDRAVNKYFGEGVDIVRRFGYIPLDSFATLIEGPARGKVASIGSCQVHFFSFKPALPLNPFFFSGNGET